LIRLAGLAGLAGPPFFGAVLLFLTCLQFDFMRSLGWDPVHAPSFDWPSGLALGPYGPVMTAALLLAGAATIFFAYGLRLALQDRVSPTLLGLAGLAMAGLAFTTDPTLRTTPVTWHGRLHDLSFAALGLALIPAMLFLGRAFRGDAAWRALAIPTWLAAALSIPAFALKGLGFYVFILAMLTWFEISAWRLLTARAR
jgi:hypothetical protein